MSEPAADWFENNELFFAQLAAGHGWAQHVADRLMAAGVAVDVTPMEVRAHIDDRSDFSDEWDLTVGAGAPCRVDVKSRDLAFTSPEDYPYATALVDTVAGWNAKTHRPHAIVLVSQRTEGLLVIPVSSEPRWTRQARFDRIRRIHDEFFEVAREELRPICDLIAWLHRREQRRDD